jgi:exopolysaccharide biosynthesis polyprenyl glycosylphosphotransferase
MIVRANNKWFPGWFALGRRGKPQNTLLSADQIQIVLQRERLRADRNGACFSILTLSFRRHSHERDVTRVARIIQTRIRVTDDAGHLGPEQIAVVLPETPAKGAWKLADDVCRFLPSNLERPKREVYEYPSGCGREDGVSASDHKARPMHELIVEPLPMWKRALDVGGASTAIIVAAPLMLLVALLIKWQSPGPALYQHERIGRHQRRFKVWKFRTMVCNADVMLKAYLAACPQRREEWNREHKLKDDPRITPIGRWLRTTSIDEIPQLWNVLRGEMSLVGPRPIVSAEICKYADKFGLYCNVLPGITGLWQISGRNDTTYAERVELDSYYARNWSLWLDLNILVKTVRVVLLRRGAY